MGNFTIKLNNVGCIDDGTLSISENKLNIKYGPNGIGKSTVIKALKRKINNEQELKKIITSFYNANFEPQCVISDNSIQSLAVYDRNYFDKLFTKREDLLNDTYSFVIKDPNYDKMTYDVEQCLLDIFNVLNRPEFDKLISLYETLTSKSFVEYRKNGNGVNGRMSLFPEFCVHGVKLESVKSDSPIFEFCKYLESSFRADWLKWLNSCKEEWIIEDICPFCGQKFFKENFTLKKNIEEINNLGTSFTISEHNKEQTLINMSANYCSDFKMKSEIININKLTGKATKETFEPLQKFVDSLEEEIEKIIKLKSCNAIMLFNSLKNYNGDFSKLINDIRLLKVDESILMIEYEENGIKGNLIKTLNIKIDALIKTAKSLETALGKLANNLVGKVKNNEKLINDFLEISGIPYEVNIEGESTETYKTLFKYKKDVNIIEDRLNYLSFGEANALALIIFAIENKGNNSLIVLDDPVSSFDNNKRYAIYNYLFDKKNNLLHGKTTILMTHDFQTVVNFAKSSNLQNLGANFCFLSNMNKKLVESSFDKSCLYSSVLRYKDYAKDNKNDLYSRVVAVRRVTEIEEGNQSAFYNYLSELVHPEKRLSNSKRSLNLDKSDIAKCNRKISKLLNEKITFNKIFGKITNYEVLINDYHNSTTSKFAKTCIARVLVNQFASQESKIKTSNNFKVGWNFLCNSFHVETQYLYSIKKIYDMDIPDYIISLCDQIITIVEGKILKSKGAQNK